MQSQSFENEKMNTKTLKCLFIAAGYLFNGLVNVHAEEAAAPPKAFVDGTGPGWRALGEQDFANVNCDADTWTWSADGVKCTGQPVGVIRSQKPFTNFELVAEWRHLEPGGNSGIFVWTPRGGAEGPEAGHAAAGRHRSAGARPRLHRAIRKVDRQEGRLVHDARRRVPRRHGEDEAVPADRRPTASAASRASS